MHRIKNSRGLTLLEVIIVLAITGLVIGLVWIVVADATLHNQVNQTERAIITTAIRIRDFYRDRPVNPAAPVGNLLTVASVIDTNLASPDLVSNGTLMHHLGVTGAGAVKVSNVSCTASFTNPSYGFEIELDQLTAKACSQLAVALAGTSAKIQSNDIVGLYIARTNVILAGPPPTFGQAAATAGCVDGVTMEICFTQVH